MGKKKKHLSKRKQRELLRKQGYTYRQINKLPRATKDRLSDLIISDKEDRKKEQKPTAKPKTDYQRRKLQRQNRITQKRFYLDSIGIPGALQRGVFTDRQIDHIKQKDIELGRVNRTNYPELFREMGFDYDQIYDLKNNERMFIAFRDYQGEVDIETELRRFSKESNGSLLDGLEAIVNTPPTYRKGGKGASSGKAGDFKFMVADQETLLVFNKEAKKETAKDKRRLANQSKASKRKLKRGHFKGDKVGYQVLKDGNRLSYDKVTPRNLLIMANAIMYNVTEKDRITFYNRFYADITKHIPEMLEILPKPRW